MSKPSSDPDSARNERAAQGLWAPLLGAVCGFLLTTWPAIFFNQVAGFQILAVPINPDGTPGSVPEPHPDSPGALEVYLFGREMDRIEVADSVPYKDVMARSLNWSLAVHGLGTLAGAAAAWSLTWIWLRDR